MSIVKPEDDKAVEARIKKTNEALLRPGIKREEVTACYDKWAKTYDEDVLQRIPASSRTSCRVLDVAAGTGCMGQHLRREGFR
ncbi:hypothetical protein E2C01_061494 [Portunus trituberculatus]|uniref:Uncharacterized protein n=1 Tax=Portunus trituberculatus TaxID=210409 RepID=A0A5B7H5D6_PORTR|nr:hypothetical protein [Portunus trituberculatus]